MYIYICVYIHNVCKYDIYTHVKFVMNIYIHIHMYSETYITYISMSRTCICVSVGQHNYMYMHAYVCVDGCMMYAILGHPLLATCSCLGSGTPPSPLWVSYGVVAGVLGSSSIPFIYLCMCAPADGLPVTRISTLTRPTPVTDSAFDTRQ